MLHILGHWIKSYWIWGQNHVGCILKVVIKHLFLIISKCMMHKQIDAKGRGWIKNLIVHIQIQKSKHRVSFCQQFYVQTRPATGSLYFTKKIRNKISHVEMCLYLIITNIENNHYSPILFLSEWWKQHTCSKKYGIN